MPMCKHFPLRFLTVLIHSPIPQTELALWGPSLFLKNWFLCRRFRLRGCCVPLCPALWLPCHSVASLSAPSSLCPVVSRLWLPSPPRFRLSRRCVRLCPVASGRSPGRTLLESVRAEPGSDAPLVSPPLCLGSMPV